MKTHKAVREEDFTLAQVVNFATGGEPCALADIVDGDNAVTRYLQDFQSFLRGKKAEVGPYNTPWNCWSPVTQKVRKAHLKGRGSTYEDWQFAWIEYLSARVFGLELHAARTTFDQVFKEKHF